MVRLEMVDIGQVNIYLSRPDEQAFAIDLETVVIPFNQVSETIASEWPLRLLRIGEGGQPQRQGEGQALEETFHAIFLSKGVEPDKLREVETSGHDDIYPPLPTS
jgi:hypothetical protein